MINQNCETRGAVSPSTYVVRAEASEGRPKGQDPVSTCETGPCRWTGRSGREGIAPTETVRAMSTLI